METTHQGTVTISLERFKELEEAERLLNSKAEVVQVTGVFRQYRVLNKSEATAELLAFISKQGEKIQELRTKVQESKPRRWWFSSNAAFNLHRALHS